MEKQELAAMGMIVLLLGGGVYYLTEGQYNDAWYCFSSNQLKIGDHSEVCLSEWQNLREICGEFKAGHSYQVIIDQYTCSKTTCLASRCEVSET